MKIRKLVMAMTVAITMITVLAQTMPVKAEEKKLSTQEWNQMLQEATGSNKDYKVIEDFKYYVLGAPTDFKPSIDPGFSIMSEDEISKVNAMTMATLATIEYEKSTLEAITKKHPIPAAYDVSNDWSAATLIANWRELDYRESELAPAATAFYMGLFPGKSVGNYTNKRDLGLDKGLTQTEATEVIGRIKDKTKRAKFAPNGKMIRTTNLPKNYKEFDYIVADYPNEFYEMKPNYEFFKLPGNARDASSYKDWDKNVTEARELLLKHGITAAENQIKNSLSFDYRKNPKTTYWVFGDNAAYVKAAKKAKIVMECEYTAADRAVVYHNGKNEYVRVAARFRFVSGNMSGDLGKYIDGYTDLIHSRTPGFAVVSGEIYSDGSSDYEAGLKKRLPTKDENKFAPWGKNYLGKVKIGEWIDVLVDVPLFSTSMSNEPQRCAITSVKWLKENKYNGKIARFVK